MADESMNDTSPCDQFNNLEYQIIAGIRAALGLFSLICCLLVILVILLFKRYHYFVQRLVLYVCIAAAINSLAIMGQKADYIADYKTDVFEKYCIFAGFFELFTSQVELIALLCITHGLYRSVVKERPRKHFEGVYIGLSLILPCILSCLPFFGYSYGKTGPWCWIRERNDDCGPFYLGIGLQFALWYGPLLLVIVVVLMVSVATLYGVHRSIESSWQGPYDPELFVNRGRLKKVVKVILAYLPIAYLLVNLFSLPSAIYWAIGDKPVFALWVLHAVFPPLRGALLALPYLFHNETRRQISKINIKAAIKRRFNRKTISTYPAKQCTFSDSLTFPSTGDTTIERQRPYHNPSLKYNTPTPPNTASPQHKPNEPSLPEEVVTLKLDGDSSTLSSVTLTQSTTMSGAEVDSNGQLDS